MRNVVDTIYLSKNRQTPPQLPQLTPNPIFLTFTTTPFENYLPLVSINPMRFQSNFHQVQAMQGQGVKKDLST